MADKKIVSVPLDDTDKLLKWLERVRKVKVFVGVTEQSDARGSGDIGNAALAYIHEHGSPARNIPARPFMTIGINKAMPAAKEKLTSAVNLLYSNPGSAKAQFMRAGDIVVKSIRETIMSSVPPPLKPDTLRQRRKHGNERDTTLLDTGDMARAFRTVIEGL